MSNRVVITGIGAITPIGIGREAFWKALLEGKNGIGRITRFDASECHSQIAGEVKTKTATSTSPTCSPKPKNTKTASPP